jgi:hypothetical protein
MLAGFALGVAAAVLTALSISSLTAFATLRPVSSKSLTTLSISAATVRTADCARAPVELPSLKAPVSGSLSSHESVNTNMDGSKPGMTGDLPDPRAPVIAPNMDPHAQAATPTLTAAIAAAAPAAGAIMFMLAGETGKNGVMDWENGATQLSDHASRLLENGWE